MLLYIHVPFCRRKCHYCAFSSEALVGSPKETFLRMRSYTDTLLIELQQWGNALGRRTLDSVFFGGGTPSLLPLELLARILERMRQVFHIPLDTEITLEGNPESLTDRTVLRQIRGLGINRLSLGVQSLHDMHLETLGRAHRALEAQEAFFRAREAGFQNINIDLMWGLPNQSLGQWFSTVKSVRDMQPEHVSAYSLTIEEGTAMADSVAGSRLQLPEERTLSMMYTDGSVLFEEAGLVQYEISNYARSGRTCRHNMGYWEQEDYLGLGPSATSTLFGYRWTNPSTLGAWSKAVGRRYASPCPRGEEKPLVFIEKLSDAEKLTLNIQAQELLMLRLRTVRGLSLRDYKALTGRDLLQQHPALFQGLRQHDMIRARHGMLSLTRKGMLVSNSIIQALFDYEQDALIQLMATQV